MRKNGARSWSALLVKSVWKMKSSFLEERVARSESGG